MNDDMKWTRVSGLPSDTILEQTVRDLTERDVSFDLISVKVHEMCKQQTGSVVDLPGFTRVEVYAFNGREQVQIGEASVLNDERHEYVEKLRHFMKTHEGKCEYSLIDLREQREQERKMRIAHEKHIDYTVQ